MTVTRPLQKCMTVRFPDSGGLRLITSLGHILFLVDRSGGLNPAFHYLAYTVGWIM